MPRKPKTTAPEAAPVEAAPEVARGAKTAAIRAAVKANPKKGPSEIADLMKAEGWDVKPQNVSVVKSAMKKGKKKKAAPAPEPDTAPVVPKDAVSVGLLVKAKKLVHELGGVKEAKNALNALAQLLD